MKRTLVAGLLFALALAVAVRAQAPETPFAFDTPSSNAASCGGGFTCFAGFQSADGTQDVSAVFTVGGGPITVRIWNPKNYPTYAPQIHLSGGTTSSTQTLTNPGGYPAVYHVVQTTVGANEFVNGEAIDSNATMTLNFNWERVGRSGRGGGWTLSFPGGISLSGSY
jgi:hypothetical protein